MADGTTPGPGPYHLDVRSAVEPQRLPEYCTPRRGMFHLPAGGVRRDARWPECRAALGPLPGGLVAEHAQGPTTAGRAAAAHVEAEPPHAGRRASTIYTNKGRR